MRFSETNGATLSREHLSKTERTALTKGRLLFFFRGLTPLVSPSAFLELKINYSFRVRLNCVMPTLNRCEYRFVVGALTTNDLHQKQIKKAVSFLNVS